MFLKCRHYLFLLVLMLSLLCFGTSAAITDVTGPVISDVMIMEAGQTLTVGDTVHFSAKITDPSGVSSVYLEIRRSSYAVDYRINLDYNSTTDRWEGAYSIIELTKDGTYMVYQIDARDLYNNSTYYFYYADVLKNVGTFTVTGAQSDGEGPEISDVTVLEAGQTLTVGDTVHFSAKISDPSGVSSVYLEIRRSSYAVDYRVNLDYNSASDRWEGSYSITELTRDGTYMVYQIDARDQYNNSTYYFYYADVLKNVGTFFIYTGSDPQTLTVSTDGNGRASAYQTYGIEGTVVYLSTIPNNGYKFKELQLISGNGSISGNEFTFGSESAEIRAVFEENVYYVSAGYGQEYTRNSDEDTVFVIKRTDDDSKSYRNFRGLEMDGNLVDPQWYDTAMGSLIIILKAEFMETLSDGEHIMTVLFTDGKSYVSFDVEEEDEEPTDPMDLTVEIVNLKPDGSKCIPEEISSLILAVRIQLSGDSATSRSTKLVTLDFSRDRSPVITKNVTFNKKLDDLAPGKYSVIISGLPETVSGTEDIYIAEESANTSLRKYKYSLSAKGEINEKDGVIVIRIYLIWDDGSRPEEEIRVVGLPEDEIGAYAIELDGRKQYLIFQTYDICMAYLGSEELCRGNERCYHK